MSIKPEKVFIFMLLTAPLFSSLPPLAGAIEDGLLLELASVIFRHGDRSPLYTFPNDTYKESDWSQGYGQLSIVGMQQQFHLGELLKARYVIDNGCTSLICSNYTRVQVRVRSTDYDRTLMSVEAQLAALFPPGPNQRFNASLLWQPIPVHMDEEKLLHLRSHTCVTYATLLEEDKDLPEYKEMEARYKDFLEDIANKSGLQDLTFANVNRLTDTIIIETVSNGYDPPGWVDVSVLATMRLISDFILTLRFNTKEKNRLTAELDDLGLLRICAASSHHQRLWLEKVLFDMKSKSNPNGNQAVENMKLFLYSAHDSTVAAMTSALQVFNNKQPGYATAFAVELYSNASNNFFVKMFHRDGPNSETFELLNVKYCKDSGLCTLEEFESFVTPLIPDDLALECGNIQSTDRKMSDVVKVIVIVMACFVSLVSIISMALGLAVSYPKRKKFKKIISSLT